MFYGNTKTENYEVNPVPRAKSIATKIANILNTVLVCVFASSTMIVVALVILNLFGINTSLGAVSIYSALFTTILGLYTSILIYFLKNKKKNDNSNLLYFILSGLNVINFLFMLLILIIKSNYVGLSLVARLLGFNLLLELRKKL